MKIDRTTKRWIRNRSDELAVANGCRFDEARGQFVVNWIEQCCKLYEGEWAGQQMVVKDWAYEVMMRLFGWVKHSERWGREVRRFRKASIWVPKKNKKSPTLAAIGLYLLCADGEQGQKVYFGAKDGSQAREIAGKHAIEMVEASDDLSMECSINKSLMQITHEESRSILKPISSADSKSQKSKEGLNGSVLIDETHVVDEAFVNRISRAGISRSEPLWIEVSTAGDNPEGYGRKSYEYGKKVEIGELENERLLFASWEAPQDLSDEELDANPVKYGKLANPAWGHTVGEEEFLADYSESKKSLTDLGLFKMYRLNIWQSSSNPWLRSADWRLCGEDYTERSLFGKRCFAGLDLAKVNDTAALVLIFPISEDSYRVWPYYWLPKDTAEALKYKVGYLGWEKAGHITLTHGNWCDYGLIREKLNFVRANFDLQCVAYDPYMADVLIQQLTEEDGWKLDLLQEFKQVDADFAGPSEEFERLVVAHTLHHPNNEVLTWQAGHVTYPQNRRYKRPMKPAIGPHLTIDGIVSTIMGLGLAMQPQKPPSVYEHRRALQLGEDNGILGGVLPVIQPGTPVRQYNWQEW